ncbi:MAG: MBL fold metallo-hydrolase [Marinilabiliales bacterium]|nr:MBL fold metallo-hydrolase [Marinilabiliales bacterium]
MKNLLFLPICLLLILPSMAQNPSSQVKPDFDSYSTPSGPLVLTFIGHGSLMIQTGQKIIQIDPVSREADYTQFPKADLVLITHEHGDHLDPKALALVTKPTTEVILSKSCAGKVNQGIVMNNGDQRQFGQVSIEALPAYNIIHTRNGQPYHPKGNGNGYLISFGGKKVYVAGDTENIPEMAGLRNIDIAFLPMNLPYTMTPEMVAEGAKSFHPAILYPYHMGETDPARLVDLLKDSGIEVRIRKMK